jgi:hypothetical protein
LGDEITEDEMDGPCGTQRRRESHKVFVGKPEEKRLLRRSKRIWKIIMKWILKKQDANVWAGFIRLGIQINSQF